MNTKTKFTIRHFCRLSLLTPRALLLIAAIIPMAITMTGCETKRPAEPVETDTTEAPMERKTIPPSSIPAAVVLVGPKASIYASSANYDVSGASSLGGNGYDLASNPDSECTGKSGISIQAQGRTAPQFDDYDTHNNTLSDMNACENPIPPTAYNDVCISLSRMARADIKGTHADGGNIARPNPDITVNDQTFTGDDAAKLYEDIIANGAPDQTLPNPATSSDFTHWGTKENPVVIHAPGDLSTPGNNTGYGILVVDGNLNVSGILTWNGIILIGACPTCTGKLIGVGRLLTNGTVIIGNNNPDIRSTSFFNGSARLNYSCEGINIANGAY